MRRLVYKDSNYSITAETVVLIKTVRLMIFARIPLRVAVRHKWQFA